MRIAVAAINGAIVSGYMIRSIDDSHVPEQPAFTSPDTSNVRIRRRARNDGTAASATMMGKNAAARYRGSCHAICSVSSAQSVLIRSGKATKERRGTR